MRVLLFRVVFVMLLSGLTGLLSNLASAHTADSSVLTLQYAPDEVQLRLEIPVKELSLAAPDLIERLPPEVGPLKRYLHDHLMLTTREGAELRGSIMAINVVDRGDDGPSISVTIHARLSREQRDKNDSFWPLILTYDGVVHAVRNHKLYVVLEQDVEQGIFSNNPIALDIMHYQRTQITLERGNASWLTGFTRVISEGMHHIIAGADHLLYLLCLLAIAASHRSANRLATRKVEFLGLISAFSVGHTVSLVFSTLGHSPLPASWVEPAVAITIILAALRLLFFKKYHTTGQEYVTALIFGVIHGMAFSEFFQTMSLSGSSLFLALLGFNIGVELIQLIIALLVVPCFCIIAASCWGLYFRWALGCYSLVAGTLWLLGRVIGLDWHALVPSHLTGWVLMYAILVLISATLWIKTRIHFFLNT